MTIAKRTAVLQSGHEPRQSSIPVYAVIMIINLCLTWMWSGGKTSPFPLPHLRDHHVRVPRVRVIRARVRDVRVLWPPLLRRTPLPRIPPGRTSKFLFLFRETFTEKLTIRRRLISVEKEAKLLYLENTCVHHEKAGRDLVSLCTLPTPLPPL